MSTTPNDVYSARSPEDLLARTKIPLVRPNNPNDAYAARSTEIADLLARIETALASRVPARPDWADVGSLTEIAGRLRGVAEYAERISR